MLQLQPNADCHPAELPVRPARQLPPAGKGPRPALRCAAWAPSASAPLSSVHCFAAPLHALWPVQLRLAGCLQWPQPDARMWQAVGLRAALPGAGCIGRQHSWAYVLVHLVTAAGWWAALWAQGFLRHLLNPLAGPGSLQQCELPACGTATLRLQMPAGPRPRLVSASADVKQAVHSRLQLAAQLMLWRRTQLFQ